MATIESEYSEVYDKPAKTKSASNLRCTLCNRLYQEPKLLPCFHTFCKIPCLERLVVQGPEGQTLTCPTCKYRIPLPENGVAGLQTNFQVGTLARMQSMSRRPKKVDCENCKKLPADKYCQECKKFMCTKCIDTHQMWGDFSGHTLLDAHDVRATSKSQLNCKEHERVEAKLHCETCSELICNDCTYHLHRDHKFVMISVAFPKQKEQLVASLKLLKRKLETVENALKDFNTRAREIDDQKASVEADIREEVDQLHKLLDQRRVELVANLESYTKLKQQQLAMHREQVEMTRAKMSSCLEYAEAGLETGTEREVLRMKGAVLKRIEEIDRQFDPSNIQATTKADIKWVPNNQVSHACKEVGDVICYSIDSEAVYDDLDFQVTSNEANNTVSHRGTLNRSRSSVSERKFSESGYQTPSSVSAHGRFFSDKSSSGSVSDSRGIRPPGSMSRNPSISSLKQKSMEEPQYKEVTPSLEILRKPATIVNDLSGPFGVATNRTQQLVVIDGNKHQVVVMNPGGQVVSRFGRQGTKKGQFKRPCGVAVDHVDNIYVVDSNNHRIQKFTTEGRFLGMVGGAGNSKVALQFANPIGICFNKTSHHLYVCDQANSRIQVFSTNLAFIRNFSTQGEGDGELNYPKSAAFDSSNNLYVTDCGNNRVQVFTADGRFLRSFSYKANGMSLEKPFAIAVDSSDNVYVSELNRHCVNVFTCEGEYKSSFGRNGSEEGFFKDIGCLCAYGNSMIVADTSNNRLQIF